MSRIDAHLHVWRASEAETPGVRTFVPPQTDVPIELAVETMADHDVERAVLVQPVFRGEDNHYVAECAAAEPEKFAAVCVVDPRVPNADARLAHWISRGGRGLRLRPRIAAEEAVFGDASAYPLWEAAERLDVVVSLLSSPRHNPTIADLATRFPSVPIIIDHLGHPDAARGNSEDATRSLLSLSRHSQIYIKLSGFYHFSPERFPFRDCWPHVRAVYEHFGPQRLLWGSDFPHVLVASSYARSIQVLEHAIATWNDGERELVLGGNALRLYWPRSI